MAEKQKDIVEEIVSKFQCKNCKKFPNPGNSGKTFFTCHCRRHFFCQECATLELSCCDATYKPPISDLMKSDKVMYMEMAVRS